MIQGAVQQEDIWPRYQVMSGLGQDEGLAPPPPSTYEKVAGYLSLVGTVAGVYHGYKRSPKHKVWGAIGYGLLGGIWFVGLPVMLAQGYGKQKR